MRKPSKKQQQTFEHMKKADSLKDAMVAGGYSLVTASHPKQNFIGSKGFKTLVEKYKHDLENAGFTTEMLAEIQMEGLFDQDAKVRLEYIRETKKDIGLITEDKQQTTQVNIFNQSDFIKNYEG